MKKIIMFLALLTLGAGCATEEFHAMYDGTVINKYIILPNWHPESWKRGKPVERPPDRFHVTIMITEDHIIGTDVKEELYYELDSLSKVKVFDMGQGDFKVIKWH